MKDRFTNPAGMLIEPALSADERKYGCGVNTSEVRRSFLSKPLQMIRKTVIITGILLFCLVTAKPVFSQCGTTLAGIDSLYSPSNPFILSFFNDSDTLLYFAGGFVNINTTLANNVANWDGDTFNVFNQGLTSAGLIKTLMVYKNKLYMGGGLMRSITLQVQEILPSGTAPIGVAARLVNLWVVMYMI